MAGHSTRSQGRYVHRAESKVRRKLLACATDLFNRRGYAATSVREIVAATGVTKPVLYHYFGSKEGTFLEIMQDFIRRFEARIENFPKQVGPTTERVAGLCDQMFQLFREHTESVRLMYSIYFGPPQGAPAIDCEALYRRLLKAIQRAVEEGIRAKEIRAARPQDTALTILGVLNMAVEAELAQQPIVIGRKGLRRMLELLFSGIAPKKPLPKGKNARENKNKSYPPTVSPGAVGRNLRLLPN